MINQAARAAAVLTLWWAICVAGSAAAQEVANCSRASASGERVLCHEIVLDAPASEVWALLTTAEGWRSWAAPVVAVDLRIGGEIETSYDVNAAIGGASNIHNRILAFTPERLLVIQIAAAPSGIPHAEEARQLSTVMELEPVGDDTRVRVSMLGYRSGDAFDALHQFFDAGNAYTLTKLAERVENGSTDWTETRTR